MTKKFKKYIIDAVGSLKGLFLLQEWDIVVGFSDAYPVNVSATVEIQVDYLRGNITIYECLYKAYQDGDYEEIKRALIHEFSHFLLEPVVKPLRDNYGESSQHLIDTLMEQQTQRIANVIRETDKKVINNLFEVR